jgi:hypothetical protein
MKNWKKERFSPVTGFDLSSRVFITSFQNNVPVSAVVLVCCLLPNVTRALFHPSV